MIDTIKYYSTNGSVGPVTLKEALFAGQASDLGLFMPNRFPQISREEIAAFADCSYAEVSYNVLSRYTMGVLDNSKLFELCRDAYDFEVPLERIYGRRYIMRLDRGPTASFKDFAARMMARLMSFMMESDRELGGSSGGIGGLGGIGGGRSGDLVILTATSGDTGSAVAHAYHGLEGVQVVILFPVEEVSDRQRKQMTTLGGNVTTIGIEGKFDHGQALVKRAFADDELGGINLTSANSINIGRLLPQTVYYFYAYSRLADVDGGEGVVFSVPSGNFGDMMGGVFAKHMGLPIEKFVIATNANDEFPNYLASGNYEPIVPSRVCVSNAMNVGHPSNLARLVDVYGGHMDEKGGLIHAADMESMRRDIYGVSISDEVTRDTIREFYENYKIILEPHGAVGWAGLCQYLQEEKNRQAISIDVDELLCVSIETAHPGKFPEEIVRTIGVEPVVPDSLQGLETKQESYEVISADYEVFKGILIKRFCC